MGWSWTKGLGGGFSGPAARYPASSFQTGNGSIVADRRGSQRCALLGRRDRMLGVGKREKDDDLGSVCRERGVTGGGDR